jgi:hypothetical protein
MHVGTKNTLKSNNNHTPIQVKSLIAQVYIYIRLCIEFSLLKIDKRKESEEGGAIASSYPYMAPPLIHNIAWL